ncbi:sulfite exporter TauE/SafE family protein [Butyricicoccus sp. OM04-18BH]|nr:sulfite exporter TauE/SafE family protein [Butyricicoccus sp. AM42-5AC]RHT57494.1 sulfite exporter TauE/SafE family protein [Butyricicoccus sp. AM29-23AC]RHV40578.1 sulfite exporter TauE/SafE family protein [Butyricicoccus sp. OM04-18BH]
MVRHGGKAGLRDLGRGDLSAVRPVGGGVLCPGRPAGFVLARLSSGRRGRRRARRTHLRAAAHAVAAPCLRPAHPVRRHPGGAAAVSAFVVGLLTGVLSGCGIGGGSLLLLWLTLVQDMPQFTAGGINLLYFLACAPAALVSHLKNHLIDRGAVKFCVPFGAMTSLLASFAAAGTDTSLLRRLFGVLLLYIGAKELFTKRKNPGTDPKPSSSNRVTRENHGGSPPRNP